ncbi:hypothetical protein TD95_003781 [Thielaviopsis punctulata]|uniref:PCI domain-containing protein n=1 Tax=Thielaviopsis punctulata TaxID=72032 RepID=A0A0F4ZH68_9PEZI|nr:hypothetical protein TD95_003781 [Thielaviopsis punctulata]
MSQLQTLSALEPFIVLSKSATSSITAAELVTRATSDPKTFVFAELLETESVKNLATSDKADYYKLLQIFSYGTYQSYKAAAGLPELNNAQCQKLRQLSLLTLAQNPENLTYAKLMEALDLPTARELENIVISAVYAGLLDATLDPHRQVVEVNSVAPLRDLAPGGIEPLLAVLKQWSGRCADTLNDIEAEISKIKAAAAQRKEYKDFREANYNIQAMKSSEDGSPLRKGLPQRLGSSNLPNIRSRQVKRAQAAPDGMDLDLDEDQEQKKRTSRRKL